MIVATSFVKTDKIELLTSFDAYLTQASLANISMQAFADGPPELPVVSVEQVTETSTDILNDIFNLNTTNASARENRCPILDQSNINLPEIPPIPGVCPLPPIPQIPNLDFLQQLDVPMPVLAVMFGAVGRAAIKASSEYAANKARDELIKLSQGDQCVIEIANKLQLAMKAASDLQYLIAQPVIIPTGIGSIIPT